MLILFEICLSGGRSDVLIRIACHELEAWYFGDPRAMVAVFNEPLLEYLCRRARFRDPDRIVRPANELRSLCDDFQKIDGARRMGALLDPRTNKSKSFQVLIDGIRNLT